MRSPKMPPAVRLARGVLLAATVMWVGVRPLAAQQRHRRVEALRTYDGRPLDFTPDGVWRVKARRVAQQRARLLSQRRFSVLNAPIAQAAFNGSALAGTLYVPTIMVGFSNTNTANLPDTAQYDSVLYTTTPLRNPQRAYSLRTFYEEMSHGLFSVQGKAYGWALAANNQSYYLNACSTGPMDCNTGITRLGQLLDGALAQVDATVDFSQYDNDGPDGVPNSGDDDGVVDLVQFLQPVVGEECGGPGYNAHHYALQYLTGSAYTTNDAAHNGGFIKVNNYQIVAGVGGLGCTSSSQIMAVGTAAHETGHGLDLPDLYDTGPSPATEGVGEWSLMGSGNYTSLDSPAHFDAWSLQQMGWVTLVPLTASTADTIGPVERSDSVMVIQPVGSNPRGEYWLIENKQPVGSDTANMNSTGVTGASHPKHGGLLVWHVDSTKMADWPLTNDVNSGSPHGLELVQADGLGQLDLTSGGNRGDAGDPYPGTTSNTRLSFNTTPANTKNSDGTFAGFELDSIKQVVAGGAMSFNLSFGGSTVVQATDTLAKVIVDGTSYGRFAEPLVMGTTHTIGMDSLQVTSDSLARYVFASWSDGQPRQHTITATFVGDTITAAVDAWFRVRATATSGGSVTANAAGDVAAGIYVARDSTIALKAAPAAGKAFIGWSGDTTASADSILVHVGKPYTVMASFQDKLVASAGTLTGPVMGSAYSLQLAATGGTGSYTWQLSSGALPDGLTLSSAGLIGGVPAKTGSFSAEVRATSGVQTDSIAVALTVTAPTLVTADVVSQILGTRTPLSADQLRYLDLLGNDNGTFDVGDFLAWVGATGAQSPAVAAAMAALGVAGPATAGGSVKPKAGPPGGAR